MPRKAFTKEDAQKILDDEERGIVIVKWNGLQERATFHSSVCQHTWHTRASTVISSKHGCPQCGRVQANEKRKGRHFKNGRGPQRVEAVLQKMEGKKISYIDACRKVAEEEGVTPSAITIAFQKYASQRDREKRQRLSGYRQKRMDVLVDVLVEAQKLNRDREESFEAVCKKLGKEYGCSSVNIRAMVRKELNPEILRCILNAWPKTILQEENGA